MANYPLFNITRVVVLLHAGQLANGNPYPIAMTDAFGAEDMERQLKRHTDAGAKVIYDGPPNQSAVPSTDGSKR